MRTRRGRIAVAAVAAGLIAVAIGGRSGPPHAMASCVGPTLETNTQSASPYQRIHVIGYGFMDGCSDMFVCDEDGTNCQPVEPSAPYEQVDVEFVSDVDQSVHRVGTFFPDENGSFEGEAQLPGDVTFGSGTLRTSVGDTGGVGFTATESGTDTVRIAGADRYETAAMLARQNFPGGAPVVYLARGDDPADALAASQVTDGPILLVPSCGDVPLVVRNTMNGLAPSQIRVLGGEAAICQKTLEQAATTWPRHD